MTPLFYRFFFFFLVYHDNQSRLSFPDHFPKILPGLVQRMLCRYVTLLSFVILKKWSITFLLNSGNYPSENPKHEFWMQTQVLRFFAKILKGILNLIKTYPLFDYINKIKCKYRFVSIWFMIPGRVYLGWIHLTSGFPRKFEARHNLSGSDLDKLTFLAARISLFYRNEIKVVEFFQGNSA